MNKLAIVYWSGTGNTETMANCIADGARESGAEVAMLPPGEFSAARFSEFGVVAFGCPAMGASSWRRTKWNHVRRIGGLSGGKKIALFGSYGWGDGQWMREWCSRCEAAGANLYDEAGLIANDSPNEEAREACRELGRKLAAW